VKRFFLVVFIAALMLSTVALAQNFTRSETLYAGGGLWGPPTNWNPITPWSAVSGTFGLVYEPLFLYDPVEDELIPWLATSGEWVDLNTFALEIREGVKWTDGTPLTAEDVKFTFELAKIHPETYYSSIWNWLDHIERIGNMLKFHFVEPLYHEWHNNLYNLPIIPKHLWEGRTKEAILTGANENPVGSGAYFADSHASDRMVYVRNDNWWATDKLGLVPAPRRIVYVVIFSNNVALGMILQGDLDVSNFFLPGIPTLKRTYEGIHTWFDEAPYMLSDNTAFLFMNTTKKPMDDAAFRRAVAFAINSADIKRRVFEDQVLVSNPLGYLPIDAWMQYYNQEIVDMYGFSYDPVEARRILAEAGYRDISGDGFVQMPDGSPIRLSIIVPFGWTDWMESIRIIASNLRAVGINAEATFPDFGRYQDELYDGVFHMAINNFGSNASNTLWTFYDWLFYELGERQTSGNFGRYDNPEVFALLDQFNRTPFDDHRTSEQILSKMQEIFLKEMPAVPLWYNGMWFQASTQVWTNYPSEHGPYHYPCTWGGRWQEGGLLMLTDLKSRQ